MAVGTKTSKTSLKTFATRNAKIIHVMIETPKGTHEVSTRNVGAQLLRPVVTKCRYRLRHLINDFCTCSILTGSKYHSVRRELPIGTMPELPSDELARNLHGAIPAIGACVAAHI